MRLLAVIWKKGEKASSAAATIPTRAPYIRLPIVNSSTTHKAPITGGTSQTAPASCPSASMIGWPKG
jgi:hypothetical protein